MNSPQFKGCNVATYNSRKIFQEFRNVDARSIVSLYISETLLFFGIILILLNNLSLIVPGSYFGAFSWVTVIVFSIGVFINFVSIPFLYFSSMKNFKKEIDFWDKELFWILPLFFFGTFFLYNSRIESALIMLGISLVIISIVHVQSFIEARKIVLENRNVSFCNHGQYFDSLRYLTVYYVLLLVMLVSYDPIMQMFFWIRSQV